MKISIPTPCHENWHKMTPKEQGSFCGSCAKIVVDFTKMKKEEIKHYFRDKKEEKTCGRFTINQLSQPIAHQISKRFLPKFAFALYLAFGLTLFSCDQNTANNGVGQVKSVNELDSTYTIQEDTVKIDTVNSVVLPVKIVPIQPIIKGDVMIEPIEYMLGEPAIHIEEEPAEEPKHHIKTGKTAIED